MGKNASWNFVPLLHKRNEDFWAVQLRTFYIVNNLDDKLEQHRVCDVTSDCRIIVDTGSSGIGIPGMYYKEILAQITKVYL